MLVAPAAQHRSCRVPQVGDELRDACPPRPRNGSSAGPGRAASLGGAARYPAASPAKSPCPLAKSTAWPWMQRGLAVWPGRRVRWRGHVELHEGGGRQRGRGLVVDEPGVPHQGQPLCRGVERRLGGDAVLQVAQLVRERAQRLHEHDADVGLGPFGPLRVAGRGEVGQRLAEAREVLGQVVDRDRRLGRRGLAGGTAGAVAVGASSRPGR